MPHLVASAKSYRSHSNSSLQEPSTAGDNSPNLESHHVLRSTPSSIHSMLRNTTETGDIGIFSIKPSRTPDPILSIWDTSPNRFLYHELDIPKHQIDQLHDHQTPLARQCHGDKGRLVSLRSQKGTDSSVLSRYQSKSQGSYRSLHDATEASDHGHSFNSRYNAGVRSQSPFAYPTRLKRLGYRPSSPALTDFNGTDVRTGFRVDRGTGTRTASPLSLHTTKSPPVGYQCNLPRFDRSTSSQYRNPRLLSTDDKNETPRPSSRLRQTPISRPLSDSTFASFISEDHHHRSNGDVRRGQQLQSPTPIFYDYTEMFEEKKRHYTQNTLLMPSIEPLGSQKQSMGTSHGLGGNLEILSIAEPPYQAAPLPTLPESDLHIKDGRSSPSPVPNDVLAQPFERVDDMIDVNQAGGTRPLDETSDEHDLLKGEKLVNEEILQRDNGNTIGHHLLSSSRQRNIDFPVNTTSCTDDIAALPCSSRSTTSSDRSSDPFSPLEAETLTPLDTRDPSPLWAMPLLLCGRPESLECKDNEPKHQSSSALPIDKTELSRVTLHAPIAEHPISSTRRRDRFSHILSIDESFDELVDGWADSDNDKKPCTLYTTAQDDAAVHGVQSQFPLRLGGVPHKDSGADIRLQNRERHSSVEIDQESLRLFTLTKSESRARSTISRMSASSYVADTIPPLQWTEVQSSISPGAVSITGSLFRFFAPATDNKRKGSNSESAELEDRAKLLALSRSVKQKGEIALPRYRLKMRSGRLSTTSLPGLCSQTLEFSHSRAEQHDIKHAPTQQSTQNDASLKIPKFKLKVTRASDSSTGTVRVRNGGSVVPFSPKWKLGTPSDLFRAGQFGRKVRADSNASKNNRTGSTPVRTRFTEEFESRPSSVSHTNPSPQSPGLRFAEVQSFFSDDSSQSQRKNSLRQRFSQFKAIASRAASSDELKGVDRRNTGLVSGKVKRSERINGRTSSQAGHSTVGMSHLQYAKWKMQDKVKGWWHRGECKIRDWGGKVKKVSSRSRLRSPDLHGGA